MLCVGGQYNMLGQTILCVSRNIILSIGNNLVVKVTLIILTTEQLHCCHHATVSVCYRSHGHC